MRAEYKGDPLSGLGLMDTMDAEQEWIAKYRAALDAMPRARTQSEAIHAVLNRFLPLLKRPLLALRRGPHVVQAVTIPASQSSAGEVSAGTQPRKFLRDTPKKAPQRRHSPQLRRQQAS